MLKLTHLLLLFFSFFTSWGQVSMAVLSDRHYLDYKIQSTLIISSEVLREHIKAGILPASQCNIEPKQFSLSPSAEEISLDLSKDVLYVTNDTLYVLSGAVQHFRDRSFLDSVQTIHPNFFTEFKYTSRKIARLHGVAAVSVWFLSEFVQIVSIPVTAALGVPELGVLIVASPLNFINMAITIKVINIAHQVNLKRAYGGHSNKRKALDLKRQIARKYAYKNENTILHQIAQKADNDYYVSINRNNLFTEAFSLFRLNQHKVYYRNMKRFCAKELPCDTLSTILACNSISKQMRTVYALEYLHKNNPEKFQVFANLHHKSFHQHVSANSTLGLREDVKKWVFNLCEIKDLAQLENILRQLPPQIKVHEVLDLFDGIILKYWAENMNKQKFKSFRKMVNGFEKSNYQLLQLGDEYFSPMHVDIILINCGLFTTMK